MTVGELIRQLETYPKDLNVVVYDDEYDESRDAQVTKQKQFKFSYHNMSGHYYQEKYFKEFDSPPDEEIEVVVFS